MATTLSFDIQTCQNTQMMPEMDRNVCNNKHEKWYHTGFQDYFPVKFSI